MTTPSNGPDRSRDASGLSLLARVYWMLLGYAPIVVSLSGVVRSERSPSLADLAFAASVAALLAVRLADIEWFAGATSDGEPATLAHWKRYAITVSTCGAVAWLVAVSLRGA